ncbi:MAG: DUF4783 domain-containing protein [Bacteroidota bacterium]
MKTLMCCFLLVSALSTSPVGINMQDITRAIGKGDAETLGMYFDQTVEVAIIENEDVYKRPEAVQMLKTFFVNNQPRSYTQVHRGTSESKDSMYSIGKLVTQGGSTYRVYLYMNISGNKHLIKEVRFDET